MTPPIEPARPEPSVSDTTQTEKPKGDNPLDTIIANIDRGHALLVALTALFAGLSNLILLFARQFVLACVAIVVAFAALAVYVIATRRYSLLGGACVMVVRRLAIGVLLAIFPISLVGYLCMVGGRLSEDGPIVAIARFDGPALPKPYDNCRPSDMLADTLNDVHQRFAHLTVFELPYVVDPNGRWSEIFAQAHGILQGSDLFIYGEYSLVDDQHGSGNPDRVLISPSVNKVPLLALGPKNAPLLEWDLPTRLVRIGELCRGSSERFLNDGHRLALTLAGLDLLAAHQYVGAQAALNEAQHNKRDDPCDNPTQSTECSGVLAFYLAVLDQRLGYDERAEREYAYAALKLHRAAPYVDLGELHIAAGNRNAALHALRSAVSAEPDSVSALATLAEYEYGYGDQQQATNDLARALSLYGYKNADETANPLARARNDLWHAFAPSSDGYDGVVLSRALYTGGQQRAAMAIRQSALSRLSLRPALVPQERIDAEVEYAKWLASADNTENNNARPDQVLTSLNGARTSLEDAVERCPTHIRANYLLARVLAGIRNHVANGSPDQSRPEHDEILRHLLTAIGAPAFTADDFVDKGNAAAELGQLPNAIRFYNRAIAINHGSVYAYSGRAEVYRHGGKYMLALRDYRRAAALHPREVPLANEVKALSLLAGRQDVSMSADGG